MKKSISKLAVILLVVASGTSFAQSSAMLQSLTQSIRSHKSMEVSFSYQTISDASQPEDPKEGMAYFQDKAYKIIMEDQHSISNGKTTWHYIVEDEEVMVGNATDDDNPFKILADIERDDTGITAILDPQEQLKRLEIELDEGLKMILNITEMKFDKDYPKDFFSFDQKAYPNVDIIDMR